MFADNEKDSRRILFLSGFFALIGVISLMVVLFQVPASERKTFSDVFPGANSPEEVLAAKHEVLASLSASSTQAETTEQQKLRVLESLRAQ